MITGRSAGASSLAEIAALLASVRRRWMAVRAMRAVARAASMALLALALVLGADRLFEPSDLFMALLAAGAAVAAAGFSVRTLRPLRRGPSDGRVARYVEERCPELQDRLASAVHLGASPSSFSSRVLEDAARRARGVDPDRVVAGRTVRRAVAGGVGAAAALAALLFLGADAVGRIARSAWLYAAPGAATLIVEPGDARLAAGESLEVRARLSDTLGALGRSAPRVSVVGGHGGRFTLEMQPRGVGYAATLPPANRSFTYRVAAAALESGPYAVTVVHAPRVERIDVAYAYPAFMGRASRVEADGGDVFAPEGAVVTLTVHADKPVRDGSLRLAGGGVLPLRREAPAALSASFEVTRDDAYRVVLQDADGLSNRDAVEYVIRALADAAPHVEVRRPGGDREITPLEEVVIEAVAEDDFALARFDLVYAVAGRGERIVDLLGAEPAARGTGAHTLYAEDLDVSPGDVVSYYLRAGDANPARVRETRSDIYFLEVRPFGREFEDAPSRSSLSMDAGTAGRLAAVQKEIIAATWRLDGRPDLATDNGDLLAVTNTQAELRRAALDAAARMMQQSNARAERRAMAAAVDAMARAEAALRTASTDAALPWEMEALAGLLRAQAAIRRTQVSRAGGGSSARRSQEDLSALFDRDLRREQENSYENRPSPPPTESSAESDALRRVRELAERQAALGLAQDDLAQRRDALGEEEAARVLARLAREQEELRERAEAIEREIAERLEVDGSRRSASSESNNRGARGAGGPMRRALAELQRGEVAAAAEQGRRALDGLRDLERALAAAGGEAAHDDGRRLAEELEVVEEIRRSLTALEARLGRLGAEQAQAGEPGSDSAGRSSEPGEGAGRDPAAIREAAQELLRRLERLLGPAEALRADRPGVLEDPARRAARHPTGGVRALRASGQDFAAWESLRSVRRVIEFFEAARTRALQAARTEGRLDVGPRESAPQGYAALVDRYYRALADHPPLPRRERR